ncbi:MAG: hypothetical protein LQ351_006371 [Letrouitia transgressa]|nr:MAG: hypothetical protein LQ351_006371 [Letrouitia transgressa]
MSAAMMILPGQANTIASHFQETSDDRLGLLMASSEVDQKFLGQFAQQTAESNPYLSSFLYKVLGLSVVLARKLIRARRLRKLDTTRDTKSLQLYHHIIWLSREGLIMVEQYVLPMVAEQIELRVLATKLRASFYHIFVLFHNQPSVHQTAIPSFPATATNSKGKEPERHSSIRASPNPMEGGPVQPLPPGLTPISVPKPAASFLLPATDYIPTATDCFTEASALSDAFLSGSHPIRLSVKTEYTAYMYDCLHDADGSRRLAQQAIKDVYNAKEGMDDEQFEDAAEMVQILGKMMKRGMGGSVGSSTPRAHGDGSSRGGGSGVSTPKATPRKWDGKTGEAGSHSGSYTGKPTIKMPPVSPSGRLVGERIMVTDSP